jgi:diguanylate cyclase (GGDEF)-like protein/putative nucleotidyltransferase with HDIG domain
MRGRQQRESELEHELSAARRRIAELQRELESRGLRDPLTGLPTVQAFGRRLDAEVDRARRHARPLAVALLDLDGFRAINSAHGREVGDSLLRKVAETLARFVRTTDLVTRTGGDEFALLLPETTADGAGQAFERILLELEGLRVGPIECISVSVGLAEYVRPMTPGALLEAAGERLAAAKAAGGGRVQSASETADPDGASDGHRDAILGLAEALTERDRYTGEHSESVVELAARVGRGLGLNASEVERVRMAALLHDIGKVAIPDSILNKDGPLDDREWEIMREHPVIGERILRAIPGMGPVARIVRHEHERFDGGGYPDGLAGEEVPIGSRIILACDAYHAMTSDRPYRKAMSHGEAVRELVAGAGTQFDPAVTEILIGCLYGGRKPAPL